MKPKILIIDDNKMFIRDFTFCAEKQYEIIPACTRVQGLSKMRMDDIDAVVLDLVFDVCPDEGLEMLNKIKQIDLDMPVIIATDHASHESAVEAMKRGAVHYTSKAPNMMKLLTVIDTHIKMVPKLRQAHKHSVEFMGKSPAAQKVRERVKQVAQSDLGVLITGESGTGKGLVANAIHHFSRRASNPFYELNSSGLGGHLFESDFFGHEQGAFTGAFRTTKGKFELANNGTLFLDEIGDLPLDTQAKVLKTIENGKFYRVGGMHELQSDVRIIAATNRDLTRLMNENTFREDLYYRLKVAEIKVPPLRERREDIPMLAHHFLERACYEQKCEMPTISQRQMDYWQSLPWKGNVRELWHFMERFALNIDGSFGEAYEGASSKNRTEYKDFLDAPYHEALKNLQQDFKVAYFNNALKKHNGNVTQTARTCNVDKATIYRFLNDQSNADGTEQDVN